MNKQKKLKLLSGLLLLAGFAGGAILTFHLRNQPNQQACINNLRMIDVVEIAKIEKRNAQVMAVIPVGTTFSKVIEVLGDNFTTLTNQNGFFLAEFYCTLPGETNQSTIVFEIRSNRVDRTGYLTKAPFPKHRLSVTSP